MLVTANGRQISCEIEGPADAPAVVFVHGLAASGSVWAEQAGLLSQRFRTVRFDMRSHGDSSPDPAPCTRSDLVADLAGLLDALDLASVSLVGHSAGGVVAMQSAVEISERVDSLVLVGTASECNERTAAWYRSTADTAVTEGGESAMKAMGMKKGSGPVPDGAGLGQMARAMASINDEPLTEALRAVEIPTLIIVGDKDFLGAGGSVILSRTIAGSELEIVEGRGHGIYIEDPQWFATRVGDFIAAAVL
jgi:pimeloyl-ACP methyl ester carboxylesterase